MARFFWGGGVKVDRTAMFKNQRRLARYCGTTAFLCTIMLVCVVPAFVAAVLLVVMFGYLAVGLVPAIFTLGQVKPL